MNSRFRPVFLIPIFLLAISATLSARDANEVTPLLIGSKVPDSQLIDQSGETVSLTELTQGKPTIIVFYRGGWCPVCNRQLQGLGEAQEALAELGYQILAISPDVLEKLNETDEKLDLGYELLSDPDLAVADAFGIGFTNNRNGKRSRLPVPSVFIVTTSGEISFTHVDPNYRFRISRELIMAAAKDSLAFHRKSK